MEQLRPVDTVELGAPGNFGPPPHITPIIIDQDNKDVKSTTKTIDIDNISTESSKFTVDLFESDIDVNFVKAKTADAKPDVNNADTNYINPGQPQNKNGTPISSSGNILKSKDDFRSGVKAALMVIDYVVSLAAMKISEERDQRMHMADSQQKKLLEDVLVEYLYGKQTQMPMWLTITFAVAGSYGLILFSAIQKRRAINKNKKLYAPPVTQTTYKPTSSNPTYTKPVITDAEMKKYQDINPTGKPPVVQPQLETIYIQQKDGTMEPRQFPNQSYSQTLNSPTGQSSPEYPDENITAENALQLKEMAESGIFPMYKKNLNGKIIKVKYTSGGVPIMAGKPRKIARRK